MSALTLTSLTKVYGGHAVVQGIDLSVASGESLSLLGPSGCGKTTTLRMIAGLERPTRGRVRIAGRDVTDASPGARGVGFVSQHLALFPHMTVEQNVAFGLKARGVPKTERIHTARTMLDRVQLGHLSGRMPSQLSGGQKQRVALARTLVTRPSLLLLDEPLSSLDASLKEEMRSLIGELRRAFGTTSVLVTHDQADAFALSDRVAVMLDGSIAQIDAPAAMYERPQTVEVARFLGDTNVLEGNIRNTSTGPLLELATGVRLPLTSTEPITERRSVVAIVRPERVRICTGLGRRPCPITAIVLSAANAGSTSTYRLDIGGAQLRSVETGPVRFRCGDHVRVEIDPDAIHIVPATSIDTRGMTYEMDPQPAGVRTSAVERERFDSPVAAG